MTDYTVNLRSERARRVRLATHGKQAFSLCFWLAAILAVGALALYLTPYQRFSYFAAAVGIICFMIGMWYIGDLRAEPSNRGTTLDERLTNSVLSRLTPGKPLTPQSVWHDLKRDWQAMFFTNHLLLPGGMVEEQLSTNEEDMVVVWQEAIRLADNSESRAIEVGHIVAAILRTSPPIKTILVHLKSSANDVEQILDWLNRILTAMRAPKPYFGGIARDWTNGFTPQLNQYGQNVSLSIERQGAHFGTLMESPSVTAIKNAFSQGVSAVALIGDPGVGKTSHVYALAQLLLQEEHDRNLEHRQIVSLNPSLIISNAGRTGGIEFTIVSLLHETMHAGHIILFLDDAQLFFKNGIGSFDITQILLPIIQHRAIQIVLAMTPRDYQQLKSNNGSFASLLTPVVIGEPDEAGVIRVLEDNATGIEARHKGLIAYEALKEAYRLSNRYEQDMAMPGKAINLLEQSLPHATNGIVTAQSVQAAIEQTRGVKVSSAAPAEADQLLHLEDTIHRRMINQSRAVTVVANALRRARAGVSNPKRPIGSFLFLGPTGVGKTELARSIAATYFGAETSMIRLDMSEYQQASDVARLIDSGNSEAASLIMSVRQQPFSVVLLDEIEKAHPNILNLLLQVLDEGHLTDASGRTASFKDTILICTSNAGANSIRQHVEQGEALESFEKPFVDELINSGQFKPELLNRFDEIVLFRPLTVDELVQVVTLMMGEVNTTLANQNISVELTPAAAKAIAEAGFDPRLGARPMRRELQRAVEDSIAARILSGQTRPGDHVVLDAADLKTSQLTS